MEDTRNAPVRGEERKPHVVNALLHGPATIPALYNILNRERPDLFRTERDVYSALHHYAGDRPYSSKTELLFAPDKSVRPNLWRLRDGEDTDEPPRVSVGDKQIRRNPFEVLGIAPDAEAEVIAASYRALARKYHPDVNRNLRSSDALARMSELNWAKDELERDLTGWRNKARSFQRNTVPSGRKSPARANVMRPQEAQEFDVHPTLAEWLAGEGERILNRLIHEGGTYNFAIAAAGDYYVQFLAARGGTTFHVEAVSNKFLPRAKRLSNDRIRALQGMQFSIDTQSSGKASRTLWAQRLQGIQFSIEAQPGGNFVLQWFPNASSAAQIAAAVLRDIYGLTPDSSLNVHVCFDDLFGDQFETP